MVQLFGDERLDYLFAKDDMKIIQSPSVFSFSLDAVLLANFVRISKRHRKILDLGTGNGVIPLILSRRTDAQIIGIEVQKKLVHMAKRSVQFNHLDEQITIIHGDLRKGNTALKHGQFDLVVCNPPYFQTPARTELNDNNYLTIARHEVYCTLEDVIKACKLYVRPGGRVVMVHRPGRLVDIISKFRAYRLEPKQIQFIYPKRGKDANMILIEAVRDAKPDLKVVPPLVIYNDDNTYTMKAEEIIHGT